MIVIMIFIVSFFLCSGEQTFPVAQPFQIEFEMASREQPFSFPTRTNTVTVGAISGEIMDINKKNASKRN